MKKLIGRYFLILLIAMGVIAVVFLPYKDETKAIMDTAPWPMKIIIGFGCWGVGHFFVLFLTWLDKKIHE